MSGMEALGRVCNIITTADTHGFSTSDCSGVMLAVAASGASSIAVTASKAFAGSYVAFTPANGFGQSTRWYQSTTAVGTAAWTEQVSVWTTNSLALAGTTAYVSVVHIFGSQMADGYKYLKVTCTNGTLVALPYDLTVQRTPANLAILGA